MSGCRYNCSDVLCFQQPLEGEDRAWWERPIERVVHEPRLQRHSPLSAAALLVSSR